MAKFNFYQDMKVSIWERVKFTIEAETEEEAEEIAKEFKDKDVCTIISDIDNAEMLYDTEEYFPLSENNGFPTIEIYNENKDEPIATNAS